MGNITFLSGFFAFFVVCFIPNGSYGANIEFFGGEDYEDRLHVTQSADYCTNIPAGLEDKVIGSVKTDVCLSMYKGPNCTAGIKWTGPGGLPKLAFFVWLGGGSHRVEYPINSYKACNGSGGQPVDLDIFGKEKRQGPVVLKVRNLNGCMNLPENFDGLTLSANNRGHGLYVWGGLNCTYPMKEVPGGVGEHSENLNVHLRDYSVGSVGAPLEHMNIKSISPQ